MVQEFYKKLINSIYENDATFLKCGDDEYSYKEFSEALESFISQFSQLEREIIVLIADKKSIEMYAAIIAIILTNNIWVPLSHQMSERRLSSILSRLQPKYVICDDFNETNDLNINTGFVDEFRTFSELLKNQPKFSQHLLKRRFVADEVAMIYFTSGSTGEPKGVLVTHKSFITNVNDMLRIIDYGKNRVFADIHDTSFVISIPVIFPCIILGGTLSIPSNSIDTILPVELFLRHDVSCLITVPSVIDRIKISNPANLEKLNIECLIVCGEPCHISTMKFIADEIMPNKIYNFYGSTEVGPWIFYLEVSATQIFDKNLTYIPIGLPINEDEIFVEEDGELIVTGPKVTKGYFGEEKNDKFFIKDGKRWFKTGDIIEKKEEWFSCLGRKDSQVKISGYRIDLMEIEGNLISLDGVEAAVCMVKENNISKYIASVVITKKDISIKKINNHLKDRLPDYMIPKEYGFLDKKPLNKNGKLDRSLLKKMFGALN